VGLHPDRRVPHVPGGDDRQRDRRQRIGSVQHMQSIVANGVEAAPLGGDIDARRCGHRRHHPWCRRFADVDHRQRRAGAVRHVTGQFHAPVRGVDGRFEPRYHPQLPRIAGVHDAERAIVGRDVDIAVARGQIAHRGRQVDEGETFGGFSVTDVHGLEPGAVAQVGHPAVHHQCVRRAGGPAADDVKAWLAGRDLRRRHDSQQHWQDHSQGLEPFPFSPASPSGR